MIDKRDDETRWDQAAEKLIKMTEGGQVHWEPEELPRRTGIREFVGPQYVAEVESRRVAVYEYRYETLERMQLPPDRGDPSGVIIEFVDDKGQRVWVWPTSTPLRATLLDAIREHVANPIQFLDALLKT